MAATIERDATETAAGASAPAATGAEYPVVYYNPRVMEERFSISGNSYMHRFRYGRYVATDATGEAAVRQALAAWGADKPDRWKGDDMRREWQCKKCGFRTRNENAKDDHELYDLH